MVIKMILKNRIDFMYIITVDGCNPNGDPNSGLPRVDFNDCGEISDVCIKRKIRNRLHQEGEEILVLPTNETQESLKSIISKNFKELLKDAEKLKKASCEKWLDVRAFGAVIGLSKGDDFAPITGGIKGCVSIGIATSIKPIHIHEIATTCCINLKNTTGKDSNTMGASKYTVSKSAYVGYGSIYPQLAELTGFSEEDCEKVKNAIIHMLDNDVSAARPAGSMILSELHWWKHNCSSGQYNIAKVHHSLSVTPKDNFPYYEVNENYELKGLKHEVYNFMD